VVDHVSTYAHSHHTRRFPASCMTDTLGSAHLINIPSRSPFLAEWSQLFHNYGVCPAFKFVHSASDITTSCPLSTKTKTRKSFCLNKMFNTNVLPDQITDPHTTGMVRLFVKLLSFFGMITVSTPSVDCASTLSRSAESGMRITRLSYLWMRSCRCKTRVSFSSVFSAALGSGLDSSCVQEISTEMVSASPSTDTCTFLFLFFKCVQLPVYLNCNKSFYPLVTMELDACKMLQCTAGI
jgi:hypothetical protein